MGEYVIRLVATLNCLVILIACGSTVPRQSPQKDSSGPTAVAPPSEPADIAVLPFQNKTGDASLNWLRTALSVTVSVRLKQARGLTTVDGSFIRQVMEEQKIDPTLNVTSEQAISLSGALFAESLIIGAFEGKEKEMVLTGALISGETGNSIRTTTVPVKYNDRSRAVGVFIDALTLDATTTLSQPKPGDTPLTDRTRNRLPGSDIGRMLSEREAVSFDTPQERDRAIKLYLQTLDTNPEFPEAHFAIGFAYDKQGERDKAISAYRQAVTLSPLNADYLYTLGYAYERAHDYRKAVERYKTALEITPDDAEIAFALGYAYEKIGEYAEAIFAYKRSIALNPADNDAYEGLAAAYESGGQLSQALEVYRQLAQTKPGEASYQKTFTAVAVKLQRWDEVIASCQSMIQRDPKNVEYREILAQAYRSKGAMGQALTTFDEIARLEPGNSSAYTSMGNIYVRQKQYDKAIQHYRTGINAEPSAPLPYYNLATVLLSQKDYRGAMEAYNGYLKADPVGEYADTVKNKVDELRFKLMTQQ